MHSGAGFVPEVKKDIKSVKILYIYHIILVVFFFFSTYLLINVALNTWKMGWFAGVSSGCSVSERKKKKKSHCPTSSLISPDWGNVRAQAGRQAGRLHCGDMSAHILQHSVRRTVNISQLQTSNGGCSLGPPALTTQTGQGAGTESCYMHELYWGFLLQRRVPIQSSHISSGHAGRG